ncbi:phosphoribosyl-ATP diphosphatase [Enterococcus sp. DIV0840]|uniref:phosphoribosyl-ATP diphosphatase n=1 Tax=Enterococcus TaxID=1350 RepID=UPI001A8F08C9|nr:MULTISPECIES: phosphoribosyl-ATP diphosphatase [Enterococcus]MBO0433047.1 phosphoribosyl-ATP diphosphatase [Enterococcus sp. DIV0849a]MBO0473066.1 phosphoribosyl-ATP diphosphatase [Enterococcus ureasiticus]
MIEALYEEIRARKEEPKEGSYTNYLFDQGLDKILKKVGEEATEVIIAAKNNQAELITETSDLIYHMLVLLVETGVSLEEIKMELKKREGKLSKTKERKQIDEL